MADLADDRTILKRRDLLAGTAVGFAAAAAGRSSASERKVLGDPDVIVVGGGLAGVTAARDLAKSGLRTLLVEARDRMGGRTEQSTLAGRQIDSGGTWFHWYQSAIWTEVQRYELPVVERPVPTRYIMGDGRTLHSMTPAEVDGPLRSALQKFWTDPSYYDAFARPFAIPESGPELADIDRQSVEDRIKAIDLDPMEEAVLRATFIDFGRPLDQVGLAWVLQRAANGVWSYEAFNALFAVYRLRDGMSGLIDKMIDDGGFDIRLSAPVVSVAQQDGLAIVTLEDGSELRSRAVVMATPANVWPSIHFTPALPPLFQAVGKEGVATQLCTFMAQIKGVREPITAFAPYGQMAFEAIMTYAMLDGDEQIVAAFGTNGGISVSDGRSGLQKAVQAFLPEAEVIAFRGHDWHKEAYSLGGAGSLQPGQLTRFIGSVDVPLGRIAFASGDLSYHFPGFLTGAIEAGIRAAHRTISLLSPSS